MLLNGDFGLALLFRHYRQSMLVTWALVALENVLIAVIPLMIGVAIDDLLSQQYTGVIYFALNMAGLVIVSVLRRVYDTRTYGKIRVAICSEVDHRLNALPVSVRNTRIDLARELVDFLENQLPELATAIIQMVVSFIILFVVKIELGISAVVLLVTMLTLYGSVHGYFFRLNGGLNNQTERQVEVLIGRSRQSLNQHLSRLRFWEIRLSDAEAVVYGAIYLLITFFIGYNLWISTAIGGVKPGQLFSIVSYSWEYAEAAIALPVALQSWSRLSEISIRLNKQPIKEEGPLADSSL